MLCRNCKKNVDANMKHGITANSCPFCGNAIFDSKEFAIRKSISRVLIKNGLDKEDQINKIVDDIITLATGGTAEPVVEAAPVVVTPSAADVAAFQQIHQAADMDDGLTPAERNAPARVLVPGPKPLAQMKVAGGLDPIALAMQEFNAANDLDAKFRREDQEADMSAGGSAEDAELANIFFMEKTSESNEVERRKAAAARMTGVKRDTPAFSRRGA